MLALLLVAVLAQGSDAEVRAEARRHFEQAQARFDARDYAAAEAAFLKSYATLPLSATAWNLARTTENLGRPGPAIGWYRRYLAAEPAAEDRAEVERAIGRQEKKLAGKGVQALTLFLSPSTARASVDDGPPTEPGTTLELPPGPHRIAVTAEGFVPARIDVDLLLSTSQGVSVTLSEAPAPVEGGFAELPAPPVPAADPPSLVVGVPTAPPTPLLAPTPQLQRPKPAPAPKGPRLRVAWAGVGLTAAALVTGAVAGTVASGASNSLRDGSTRSQGAADELVATSTNAATVANGAWIAAGVLAVATGITMVIEW